MTPSETIPMNQPSWMEIFDKEFVGKGMCGHYHVVDNNKHFPNATGIKDWIRRLLASEKERIRGEVEGIEYTGEPSEGAEHLEAYHEGWFACQSKVLKILTP